MWGALVWVSLGRRLFDVGCGAAHVLSCVVHVTHAGLGV